MSEAAVTDILKKPFRPGQFFQDCANAGVQFEIPNEDVLNKVVAAATQEFAGEFASLYCVDFVFVCVCKRECGGEG